MSKELTFIKRAVFCPIYTLYYSCGLIFLSQTLSSFIFLLNKQTNKQKQKMKKKKRNGDITASFTDILLRSACQGCRSKNQRQIHGK